MVGLAVFFRAGIEGRQFDLPVSHKTLALFGIHPETGRRAIHRLEKARLLSVVRRRGVTTRVTILCPPGAEGVNP